MELKAELLKPYTEEQRINFIVEQNHRHGYKIDEQEDRLVALGYTEEEKAEQEREQFLKDFFNTSLGYIRRQVSMQTGDTKDFLTDILPLLQVGIPILTYTEDGEQHKVMVTEDFINECKQQLLKDFYGV